MGEDRDRIGSVGWHIYKNIKRNQHKQVQITRGMVYMKQNHIDVIVFLLNSIQEIFADKLVTRIAGI